MPEKTDLSDLPQPESEGTVDPEDLHVDGDNPNEQSDEMFGLLCENIRKKGWLGNAIITDTDGCIADGEHRWRAAQEVGLSEVPVKQYDIDDADRRLWRQELNKISGEHDEKRDALEYDYLLHNGKSDEVSELVDAADEDLDELLAQIRIENATPAQYEYDGEHSVYFEDCVEGMRERLDDDSVGCVITDPPYGVDVDVSGGMNRTKEADHKGSVDNDGYEEALETFRDTLTEIDRVITDDGLLYVFASWKTYPEFATIIKSHGYDIFNCLVWVKSDTTPFTAYQGKYQYQHEFCIFAGKDDARQLNHTPSDVMEYDEARFSDVDSQATTHPTQKPLQLVNDLVRQATGPEDLVLDPFMGSGTTAVAALQNDRDYVGFELDADNYRDVIERRIGEAKRQKEASVNQ